MIQTLRALAVLSGDPVRVEAPTLQFITICNSSARASITLFWPHQALHACGTLIHMHSKHPYTLNKIFKKIYIRSFLKAYIL